MGTEKRERQKANRAKRREEELKAARSSAVKRNVVRWVVIIAAAFGVILLIAWVSGAFDGDDTETVPSPVVTLPVDTAADTATDGATTTAP